ncbi:MAG: hypothetical protein L3K07_08635, partial [Thermoplasmata archaeon]|nr:hypothetical protein [Thermoplasmata archaeon]
MRTVPALGLVGLVASLLLVMFLPALGSGAVTSSPPTHATPSITHGTVILTTCSESALATDIAAGGTVQYGAACSDITFGSTITIPANLTVNVTSGGFSVLFNGQGSTRLFIVAGGHLNLTGITLDSGTASGTAGAAGSVGSTGSTGVAGTNGVSATGGTGNPGGAGTAGTNGGAGVAGGVG